MPNYTKEISAYVTPEIKQQFHSEATDKHGTHGQSKLLRQILRERYANKQATETAQNLHIETRLEDLTARLIEDLETHRKTIDDHITLAAIYSIAEFELRKITGNINDSQARDAINRAKKRVHSDQTPPTDPSARTPTAASKTKTTAHSETNQSNDTNDSSTQNDEHSTTTDLPDHTQTGFDMSWTDAREDT